eukprot:CAMPEP_0174251684 /NCGR_PEP_ID=MMETSP0439-20130205/1424_1 /TAXON_ID=0 /ORGANISM="Stereomyxa ramosa, Strain Chinc5" /LENGTH=251 /DNA_ID=CAMNT_0015332057 /DNA_START=26 /DNA_END=781 /DNA_ORIENTATION=-
MSSDEEEPKERVPQYPPNETLYVRGIDEKVPKEDMRKRLYAIFSQFGTVLDVHAKKTIKLRGQAFIVFRDIDAASKAMQYLQGVQFYDRPMEIEYAKAKSDLITKLQGTFVERPKRPRPPRKQKVKKRKKKRQKVGVIESEARIVAIKNENREDGEDKKESPATMGLPQPKPQPPNKVLFVQNLPEEANDMMLQMLFQQFPGFKEVRMVPGGQGMAFVEFSNEMEASVAMNGLQHFLISKSHLMVISFAKQ